MCYSSLRVVQYLVGKIGKKSKLLYEGNDDGYTPLQRAFSRGSNCLKEVNEAIQLFVLKTFPKTFLRKSLPDQNGWLPLHFACAQSSKSEIPGIKLLLEHYPDAAKVKDESGRLPLQLLLQNAKLKHDVTLVEHVLRYHPDAVDAVGNAGNPAVDLVTFRRLARHMANEKGKPQAKRQKT
jgi:ankyrin repeat protein